MESTYSVSSFSGLVSSKRRLVLPPNSSARPKFEADGLGVADVQVAVGLGRKAGLHAAAVLVGLQVFGYTIAKKVGGTRLGRGVLRRFCLSC